MLNPFGEDDDDFEVNHMIDRNLQMSYLIVDEMHNEHPELLKDQYWDEIPSALPDRAKDDNVRKDSYVGPTDFFDVDDKKNERRPTVVISTPDVEAAMMKKSASATTMKKVVSETSMKKPSGDLIPRPVVDDSYLRIPNVEIKQSNLEKEMEKIREKISQETQMGGSKASSESSNDTILKQVAKRDSDNSSKDKKV